MPLKSRQLFLNQLTEEDCETLLHDWRFVGREKQQQPTGSWQTWMLMAGRGWGKTRTGAEFIKARVESGEGRRIALVGRTAADARDVMIEGESGLLNISPPWNMPRYEPSKRRLTWPNGAIAVAYSADKPDQLRGPQHDTAWLDELASWRYMDAYDQLQFGLRLGHPRQIITTTPRPIEIIRQLLRDPHTVTTIGSTLENRDNLAPHALRRLLERYAGTRIGRQELEAELLDDAPGALWNRKLLDETRVRSTPELKRIVVAIDPAVSVGEDANETGIIVAGLGENGHGYILDDLTNDGKPSEWASIAIAAYNRYMADRIIGEANNGGDMIENTIRTVRDDQDRPIGRDVSYKKIHASRGKVARAEPVVSLYEQGRVHHVGVFPQLEDQQCQWIQGDPSPDRLDAAVWAITELMVSGSYTEPITIVTRGYGKRSWR